MSHHSFIRANLRMTWRHLIFALWSVVTRFPGREVVVTIYKLKGFFHLRFWRAEFYPEFILTVQFHQVRNDFLVQTVRPCTDYNLLKSARASFVVGFSHCFLRSESPGKRRKCAIYRGGRVVSPTEIFGAEEIAPESRLFERPGFCAVLRQKHSLCRSPSLWRHDQRKSWQSCVKVCHIFRRYSLKKYSLFWSWKF
jgi:hypothetical protein